MTTSGTSTFNYNRDQIIKAALRKLGVINASETPSAQLITDGSDALNIMVKAWNATGLHIWTEEEATVFLQPAQPSYTLGGTTTDNATGLYTATTLSNSAVAGATSINVTSASGFGASYNVGVVLASGGISWSTQNGAISGTTVTLNTGLTGAASAGAAVYVYQTQITRPLRVVAARRSNLVSSIDTMMTPLSRLDYRNMPNKTSTGVPTQYFYDPRGGANTQGILNVWPAPSDSTNAVKMTWWRSIQDFTTAANTPDLPQEWVRALVWNLAVEIGTEFDVSDSRWSKITQMAAGSLEQAGGFDREPESYLFGSDQMT